MAFDQNAFSKSAGTTDNTHAENPAYNTSAAVGTPHSYAFPYEQVGLGLLVVLVIIGIVILVKVRKLPRSHD